MIIAMTTTFLGRLALTGGFLFFLALGAALVAACAADFGNQDVEERSTQVMKWLLGLGSLILIICMFAAIWGAH